MAGVLVRNGKVIYKDAAKFGGDVVFTGDAATCECCESGPPVDDWIDDRDPVFPGPGGGGPGPDPTDPDCCSCGFTNETGCRNCWDDATDVSSGVLAVAKRVRVAARIIGSLRVYAERTDPPNVDSYDETIPFELIVDSYPGLGGEFCDANGFDLATTTVTAGGRDFDVAVDLDVSFDTDTGFAVTANININPAFSPFTGGGSVNHRFSVLATSGETETNGWEAAVSGNLFTGFPAPAGSVDAAPLTLPIGGCRSRHIRNAPALAAYWRAPVVGTLEAEGGTDVVSGNIDMVVGNVIPCP